MCAFGIGLLTFLLIIMAILAALYLIIDFFDSISPKIINTVVFVIALGLLLYGFSGFLIGLGTHVIHLVAR